MRGAPSGWSDTPGGRSSPRLLSNIRLSDDEKSRSLGQQLIEDIGLQQQEDQSVNQNETGDSYSSSEIPDIVVGNPVIMQNLIESLSYCTSDRLSPMFSHADGLSNLQKTVDQIEPMTVGDLVFTVLKNVKEKCSDRNAMVDNLFRFFTGRPQMISQTVLSRLSEPLLFFTLRALCSSSTIKKFFDLGKAIITF